MDPRRDDGFAIGIGLNPWFGLVDPAAMGWLVVDEAIRNAVCAGANPDLCSLLDNFSWGDPRDPEVLGQLTATVDGMCAASISFGAPFVSGKDSLNNAWTESDGSRKSIPPTLVVTAVAAADANNVVTSDLKRAGNALVLLGNTSPEFGGSHLAMMLGVNGGAAPKIDTDAPVRYRNLHMAIRRGWIESAHDCAEGGLAVALAEMCIAGRLGATVDTAPSSDEAAAWFSESSSRIVLEVKPENVSDVIKLIGGPAEVIGTVSGDSSLVLLDNPPIPVPDLVNAWQR